MPAYYYKAMDAHGKAVRGMLYAANEEGLNLQLEKMDLFLVAASLQKEDIQDAPADQETLEPVPLERPYEPPLAASAMEVLRRTTWSQRLVLLILLSAGFGYGLKRAYERLYRNHPLPPRYTISLSQPHMRRQDIERIFRVRDSGPQDPARTRYIYGSDKILVIPYDQEGGPWSPDNRMIGQTAEVLRMTPLPGDSHRR